MLCPNCHAKTENYCGKNISITPNFRNPEKRFLSEDEIVARDLKHKAQRSGYLSVDAYLSRKNKQILVKVCPICGKEFTGRNKYCSVECYHSDLSLTNRPSAIQLINDLKEIKSFLGISKKYNVSDNAVRKWCKLYMLPTNVIDLNTFLRSQNIKPLMEKRIISSYNIGNTNSSYNTKWLNNGIINKKVNINDITEFLNNGWNIGRIK